MKQKIFRLLLSDEMHTVDEIFDYIVDMSFINVICVEKIAKLFDFFMILGDVKVFGGDFISEKHLYSV